MQTLKAAQVAGDLAEDIERRNDETTSELLLNYPRREIKIP